MAFENTKYYAKMGRYFMANFVENAAPLFIVTTVALSGGTAFLSSDMKSPDNDRAENADQIMAVLTAQRGSLEEQQAELHRLSDDIMNASENGSDAAALNSAREEKVMTFQEVAKQLVIKTVLSDELSEQERQDFVRYVDKNIINVGDLDLKSLEDSDGDVDTFSHLREARLKLDAEKPFLDNTERVQAMAQDNDQQRSDAALTTFFGFVMGLPLAMLLGAPFTRREYRENKPEKPKRKPAGRRLPKMPH